MPAADSQMTTSFFMLQSWMLDSRSTKSGTLNKSKPQMTKDSKHVPMAEKRRISNIEQGILNDEVRRAEMVDGMRTWYKS